MEVWPNMEGEVSANGCLVLVAVSIAILVKQLSCPEFELARIGDDHTMPK